MLRGLKFLGWQLGRLVFGARCWEAMIAESMELEDVYDDYDLFAEADPLTKYYETRQFRVGEQILVCIVLGYTCSYTLQCIQV